MLSHTLAYRRDFDGSESWIPLFVKHSCSTARLLMTLAIPMKDIDFNALSRIRRASLRLLPDHSHKERRADGEFRVTKVPVASVRRAVREDFIEDRAWISFKSRTSRECSSLPD